MMLSGSENHSPSNEIKDSKETSTVKNFSFIDFASIVTGYNTVSNEEVESYSKTKPRKRCSVMCLYCKKDAWTLNIINERWFINI